MANQKTVSGSTIRKFWWISVLLASLVGVVYFGPGIYNAIGGPDPTPTSVPITIVTSPSTVAKPLPVTHYCVDTPDLYAASLGKQATLALADKIDSSIVPGFPGLQFSSSYISAHSYQLYTGVTFRIPAVASYPAAPPPPKHTSDMYKNALADQAHEKDVATWQATVASMQQQLAQLQLDVKQQTDKLRKIGFAKNNSAADVYGCLATSSDYFKNTPASVSKKLIIASDLVNNTQKDELGSINLSGVVVTVIDFSCPDSTAVCQARTAYWSNLVKRAGAKSFSVYSVAESQPFPVAI